MERDAEDKDNTSLHSDETLGAEELIRRREALRKMIKMAGVSGASMATLLTTRRALAGS